MAGAYLNPALFFKEHQLAMVAHDQHGHDRKRMAHCPRFEVFLDDLELMIEWVKQHYSGLPIFIMGHSMGGLIATHYGLRRLEEDPLIKGFIISSPYYMNAVKVPWIMQNMLGILSMIIPRVSAPFEDFMPFVTHDQAIYNRHREDMKDHTKAPQVSIRLGSELLKAQRWIPGKISEWKHPLMVIVAGDDRIADADETKHLIGKINQDLVTELYYPDNFHENFNELNRDEIFGEIVKWVEQRVS